MASDNFNSDIVLRDENILKYPNDHENNIKLRPGLRDNVIYLIISKEMQGEFFDLYGSGI